MNLLNNAMAYTMWFDNAFSTDVISLIFFISLFTFGIVYDTLRLSVSPRWR